MIEWIIDNKEWLFGGIGVTVLGVFFRRFLKKNITPHVNVTSYGDSSPNIAIGGDVKDSKIVVNANEQKANRNKAEPIINDILNFIESVKPSIPNLADNDPMIIDYSAKLEKDPYDIPSLLIRGQAYYTNWMGFGGKGMRKALADFERAAETDMILVDPHFGIGTVLYQLALLDLTRRGRYKIHKKGKMRMNKSTNLLEMMHPQFDLYVDERNRLLLHDALDEFQEGNSFRQSYGHVDGVTSTFFAPRDIENRVRSLRRVLGYEPIFCPDEVLFKNFATALTRIDPNSFEQLIEFQ